MPYQKKIIEVKVPHKSGADMSHRNSGTLTCGTLTPVLVEEVIPGTRCHLKVNEVVQLPPLVSDTYMNVKLKHEAFFVPFRLLCKSAEDWFCTGERDTLYYGASSSSVPTSLNIKPGLPVIRFDNTVPDSYYKPGTLIDFLGAKVGGQTLQGTFTFSPLSIVAYHLIYDEYYRNPKVQKSVLGRSLGFVGPTSPSRLATIRDTYYHYGPTNNGNTPRNYLIVLNSTNISDLATMNDGSSFFDLHQRNFGFDFFTGARPSAQFGAPAQVSMSLPAGASSTQFTIAQLRAANSLQMFRERNNMPSPRLVDQVRARYGAVLSDGIAQRPICIGSSSVDIVSRGVDQTAADSAGTNPFNSVAAQYGRAFGGSSQYLIDDFTANEPGFIMVLQSIVPDVSYSSGVAAYLKRYLAEGCIAEMANPLLQNVGDEPIYDSLISDDPDSTNVFGYQDRFGSFMYHPNEVHSLFVDGESLDTFVLQRSFGGIITQNSSFLEIPKNYLDAVFAVSGAVSGLSAWYDAKLDWKISLPLAEFSIPSLQDPAYEHGKSVNLLRNGQIF